MSRSCINIGGNTTVGQNIGSGIDIYAGKSGVNTLQFKSLSVTGTTMAITCDGDNIYFSAQTGSGGLSSSSNGLTDDGSTVCLGGSLSTSTDITVGAINTLSIKTGLQFRTYGITLLHLSGVSANLVGEVAQVAAHNPADGCQTLITISDDRFLITDEINSSGMTYATDYSAIGETNPRWIPDAAWVTGQTGGGGAISGWTCTVNEGVSIGQYTYPYATGSFFNNWNNVAIGTSTLRSNTTGSWNIAIGQETLALNTTGGNNVVIGDYAAYTNTIGLNNTILGSNAEYLLLSGCSNTAVGTQALYNNACGCFNVGVGANALNNLDFGDDNIAIGTLAMSNQVCGCQNIGIGCESSQGVQCGNFNIGIGACSLDSAFDSSYNIGIGVFAGNGQGDENVYIGRCVGYCHTGSGSTFIGRYAGSGVTASNVLRIGNKKTGDLICGDFVTDKVSLCCLQITAGAAAGCVLGSDASGNASWVTGGGAYTNPISGYTCDTNHVVSIACDALPYNAGGVNNIAIGDCALTNSTTTNNSIAIGVGSMKSAIISYCNVAIGTDAMSAATYSHRSVAIGAFVFTGSYVGSDNVAIGYEASKNNQGGCTIAIGNSALHNNNSSCGYGTIAIGYCAAYGTLTPEDKYSCSVIIGNFAGNDPTDFSVVIGNEAMCNGGGFNDVIIGNAAMPNPTASCENVAIGYSVMNGNVSGCTNTAIGTQSLYQLSTGCDNTAIGHFAGCAMTTGHRNVLLGRQANLDTATDSDKLRIGNCSLCSLICGDFITEKVTVCCLQITAGAAAGCVLGSDASGNASWVTGGGGGGLSVSGTTDNAITTYINASGDICAEPNLKWNGTSMQVNGNITFCSGADRCITQLNTTSAPARHLNLCAQQHHGYQTTGDVKGGSLCIVGGFGNNTSESGSPGTATGGDVCIDGGAGEIGTGDWYGGMVCICGGRGSVNVGSGSGTGGTVQICGGSGDVNGRIRLGGLPSKVSETCVVWIDASGNLSTATPASDSRLKCCVTPISSASSMLSDICGYSAEFNNLSNCEGCCEYVFLAQEVEKELPLAVKNGVIINDVDYKKIEYDQLIPVMWNIIKELEARITVLESQ